LTASACKHGPSLRALDAHRCLELRRIAAVIAPPGRVGLIYDPEPLDLRLIKMKSVSIHWEPMLTRPKFATEDMIRQHEILTEVASLVDHSAVRARATQSIGTINAANRRQVHAAVEAGRIVGKLVLEGF
jgi:NADPH2:quinone reductase